MKKWNVAKGFLAMMLLVTLVFSGCQFGKKNDGSSNGGSNQSASQEKPEDVVKAMQATWTADMGKKAELDGSMKVMVDSPEAKVNVDMTMKGKVDASDITKPSMDMMMTISGDATQGEKALGSAKVDLGMVLLSDNAYLKLNELTVQSEDPSMAMVQGMVESYKGKWYMLPAQVMQQVKAEASMDEVTEAQKTQVMEALKNANLFKVTKDMGMADGKFHYSYEVDKAGLKAFFVEMSKMNGETPSEADLTEFDTALAPLSFTGEMWINKDTKKMERMSMMIAGPLEENKGNMELSFDVAAKSLETVEIAAPEGAEPLPM